MFTGRRQLSACYDSFGTSQRRVVAVVYVAFVVFDVLVVLDGLGVVAVAVLVVAGLWNDTNILFFSSQTLRQKATVFVPGKFLRV